MNHWRVILQMHIEVTQNCPTDNISNDQLHGSNLQVAFLINPSFPEFLCRDGGICEAYN